VKQLRQIEAEIVQDSKATTWGGAAGCKMQAQGKGGVRADYMSSLIVVTVFGKHCECNAQKCTHLKRLPPLASHLLLLSHCVLTQHEGQKKKSKHHDGLRESNTWYIIFRTCDSPLCYSCNPTRCVVLFVCQMPLLNYKSQLVLRTS